MSINAVKGVNIGAGMNAAFLSGEENSDEIRNIKAKQNLNLIMLEEYWAVYLPVKKLLLPSQ